VRRARAVRTRRTDPRDEQAGGPTDRSEDPTAGDRELLSVLSSPRGSPNCPPASSGGGVRERPGAGARAATCQRLPLQGRAVLPARARVSGVRGETWRALVLKERPDRPDPAGWPAAVWTQARPGPSFANYPGPLAGARLVAWRFPFPSAAAVPATEYDAAPSSMK